MKKISKKIMHGMLVFVSFSSLTGGYYELKALRGWEARVEQEKKTVRYGNLYHELATAIKNHDFALVKKLVDDDHADVNRTPAHDNTWHYAIKTPLMLAAEAGNSDIVHFLLDKGAHSLDIWVSRGNYHDEDYEYDSLPKRTADYFATNKTVQKMIVENQKKTCTAQQLKEKEYKAEQARLHHEAAQRREVKKRDLARALENGDIKMAQKLSNEGIRVEELCSIGEIITYAAENKNSAVVQYILAHSSREMRVYWLYRAVIEDINSLSMLIIRFYPDLKNIFYIQRGQLRNTAVLLLTLALNRHNHIFVQFLIDHGADVNALPETWENSLFDPIDKKFKYYTGRSHMGENYQVLTPLDAARAHGDDAQVQFLRKQGAWRINGSWHVGR